jgi:hypothetical protein
MIAWPCSFGEAQGNEISHCGTPKSGANLPRLGACAMCADVQWIVMVTPQITLKACGPTSWPMDPDLFTFTDAKCSFPILQFCYLYYAFSSFRRVDCGSVHCCATFTHNLVVGDVNGV